MVNDVGKAVVWAGAYWGAIAINESIAVPLLGTAAFVLSGLLSGVWWLGRKLQSLEDGQNEIRRWLKGLPCDECKLGKQKKPEGKNKARTVRDYWQ